MGTVIGISGSLRAGSYNTLLLRAIAAAGLPLEEASLRGIPLYDGDVEKESGVPAPVTALKDRIAAADGLVIVTPEYNAGVPGVLKNALDWLSRPPADIARVFGDKPVALTGATPGRGGTISAQTLLLPTLRALGCEVWNGPRLHVSQAKDVFGEGGKVVDETIARLIEKFARGFAKKLGRG